jgi:DNA-directed RNA polymerase subunit M/transcription elongation factor TFIIS
MLRLEFQFTCRLCENNKDFYLMPQEKKTISNDHITSLNTYIIRCKKCGKKYLFNFNISME